MTAKRGHAKKNAKRRALRKKMMLSAIPAAPTVVPKKPEKTTRKGANALARTKA